MQYLIPAQPVIFEEEIKKSRFITYLRHTQGLAQAKQFWQEIKALHPNARHHCWAAVAEQPHNSQALGFSDDGEPAGTAGKPMLNALLGSQVGEISAVVVRYYGGILLGTGGLVRAYGNGVQQALKLLTTELKIERQHYLLTADYAQVKSLQQLCEKHQALIIAQQFGQQVEFEVALGDDKISAFQQELQDRFSAQLNLQPIENKENN